MSIGIGDRVQTTITETVSDLCTVVLIIWSPRSISWKVMSLLLLVSIFFNQEDELTKRMGHICLNEKLKWMSWMTGLSIGISQRHCRKVLSFEERWNNSIVIEQPNSSHATVWCKRYYSN